MYNDNTFNGLFTGTLSGGVYTYPSAEQNLVVKFANFYLSAKDGDFTTDPVTITSETGEGEDISIGNAPAKVLTATMLNPDGSMDTLTWGDGSVYIGAETASASADTYSTYPVFVYGGTVRCGLNASGNMVRNSSTSTLGGTPVAVITNSNGSDILYITTTKIGRYNGGFSTITTPTAEQAYMAAKFRAMPHSVGVLLDANGLPSVYNSVAEGTKQTFSYVPMGVFDFSGVDAYGITFGVEAYDKMTVFDADATEWWNSLVFTAGKQLQTLAGEVVSHYGLTLAALPGTAVNKTVSWNTNPITSYAVTGRDLLKWLAEAMGCNVRMSRTGTVEFWTFNTTAVASITPDTIVSSTRVVGRKSVPAVTQTVCYNVLGAGYTATGSTTTGTTYYVVANPFIDPSTNLAPLNAIHGIVTAISAYYPITIAVSCADARWDAGDFVTVNTTDGTSPYAVPIMHETLAWNGNCVTTLSATGKQVRDIPESMLNTDLSSMVDSNPSAVVNKIQAVGISADWITSGTIDASVINVTNVDAKKITVRDSSNNVIFQADAGTRVAKFHVENGGGDVLFDVNSSNDSAQIGGFVATAGTYPYLYSTYDDIATQISYEGFEVFDSDNTETALLHSNTLFMGKGPYVDDLPTYQTNVDATSIAVDNTVSVRRTFITPEKVEVKNDFGNSPTVYTRMERTGVSAVNSTATTTLSPTGITFNDGTATPEMFVIKRLHDSANMTDNITLQRGVYLAIVSHTNNSTAGQQGLYVIQAYDTNSVVLTIAAAANSTLTVSGLTLTWTTTNTYRALRLIYLS